MFFKFLLAISCLEFSQGFILECDFGNEEWINLGIVFQCKVTGMHVTSRNSITEVIGDPYRSIRDVKALDVQDQRCQFLPSDVQTFFPSLEGLQVANSELKELQNADMQQFPNLKQLFLSENELQTLENDVFEPCPNIEYINLGHNNIMHMGTDILAPLKNLQYCNVVGNSCIDTKMESPNAIQSFSKDVAKQCPPTPEMLKREKERKIPESLRTMAPLMTSTVTPELSDLKEELRKLKDIIAEHDQKIEEIKSKEENITPPQGNKEKPIGSFPETPNSRGENMPDQYTQPPLPNPINGLPDLSRPQNSNTNFSPVGHNLIDLINLPRTENQQFPNSEVQTNPPQTTYYQLENKPPFPYPKSSPSDQSLPPPNSYNPLVPESSYRPELLPSNGISSECEPAGCSPSGNKPNSLQPSPQDPLQSSPDKMSTYNPNNLPHPPVNNLQNPYPNAVYPGSESPLNVPYVPQYVRDAALPGSENPSNVPYTPQNPPRSNVNNPPNPYPITPLTGSENPANVPQDPQNPDGCGQYGCSLNANGPISSQPNVPPQVNNPQNPEKHDYPLPKNNPQETTNGPDTKSVQQLNDPEQREPQSQTSKYQTPPPRDENVPSESNPQSTEPSDAENPQIPSNSEPVNTPTECGTNGCPPPTNQPFLPTNSQRPENPSTRKPEKPNGCSSYSCGLPSTYPQQRKPLPPPYQNLDVESILSETTESPITENSTVDDSTEDVSDNENESTTINPDLEDKIAELASENKNKDLEIQKLLKKIRELEAKNKKQEKEIKALKL